MSLASYASIRGSGNGNVLVGAVMGADPRRSVCDGHGPVRGYEGLHVANAAVLPTTLGVNPQHPIMSFARRQAGHLLG